MFDKLASSLKSKFKYGTCVNGSSSVTEVKSSAQNMFLKHLSEYALNLYQRKSDVKKFTKLVLSDPEDLSHDNLVKEKEIDNYDILFDLSNNEEFLKDLGL